MIQYLIKRKVKKEVEEKGKKALIYTGAIATGVGIYFSYKLIKNRKNKNKNEDNYYLNNNEYDLYDYDEDAKYEEDELEEKIDEFNSRRLNANNCTHVSQTEIDSYIESIEDTKEDVEIDKDNYKQDKYDEYEYIEEDLENK